MANSAAPSPGVSSPSLIGLPLEVHSMVLGYVGLQFEFTGSNPTLEIPCDIYPHHNSRSTIDPQHY